ncbi:MAG: alkaline phosphatase D family protein [Caulobacter sp.]|nr:alkaline phosphatase D family protein [Caulobacter sp.]
MRINRRGALGLLGLGGASAAATSARATTVKIAFTVAFNHGVASGDPLQDRVVLWTRLTPELNGWTGPISGKVVIVASPDLKGARAIPFSTSADRDWTVKVDVDGLKPGTDYYYRFEVDGHVSPTGRTRTLPEGSVKDVVLAVASCSLYPAGYFNAYGAIAALERVDAVLHLGDYIYEYGAAEGQYGMNSPVAAQRMPVPAHEIVSLADYRARHALYKADAQLQAAHARAPWIVVWDDHETANDSWQGGAENHSPSTEGDWATRKAAALKAYYEWMPIRDPAPGALLESSWRSFRFGDLASLMMVETRLAARGEPLDYTDKTLPVVDGKPDVAHFLKILNDPSRQLMGERQEKWLAGELDRSVKAGEAWQVLGNQIVMARISPPNLRATMGEAAWAEMIGKLPDYARAPVQQSSILSALGLPLGLDMWDGYPVARERVYDMFKATNANAVVLAGDSHSFWANELWDDGRRNRVAAEFGTTGITSPGFSDILPGLPLSEAFVERNPEVKYANSAAKGFVLLTLTRDQARADMIAVSTIHAADYTTATVKSFTVARENGVGVGPVVEG